MIAKLPLTDELSTISLRLLLQKALSHSLFIRLHEPLRPEERVILSPLRVSERSQFQYASAIAHQLAASHATQADTLAPQLAAVMTEYFARPVLQQDSVGAITTGLQIQPTSEGGLILTLSLSGLAAWLQIWQESALLTPRPSTSPMSLPTAFPGNWPLCDRLRLSLPMLLQWAHARCHTWHQITVGLPEREPRSSLLRPISDLPQVTQHLLPAVIQTVDQMAARSGENQVCLRQGYRLAEDVYRCDAEVAQGPLTRTESALLAWSEATLVATQTVLACILTDVVGMTPCRHL